MILCFSQRLKQYHICNKPPLFVRVHQSISLIHIITLAYTTKYSVAPSVSPSWTHLCTTCSDPTRKRHNTKHISVFLIALFFIQYYFCGVSVFEVLSAPGKIKLKYI